MRTGRKTDCLSTDGRVVREGDFVRVICEGVIIQGTVAEDDDDIWYVANDKGGFSPSLWTCDRVEIISREI